MIRTLFICIVAMASSVGTTLLFLNRYSAVDPSVASVPQRSNITYEKVPVPRPAPTAPTRKVEPVIASIQPQPAPAPVIPAAQPSTGTCTIDYQRLNQDLKRVTEALQRFNDIVRNEIRQVSKSSSDAKG